MSTSHFYSRGFQSNRVILSFQTEAIMSFGLTLRSVMHDKCYEYMIRARTNKRHRHTSGPAHILACVTPALEKSGFIFFI